MREVIRVAVDGREVSVEKGAVVAAAIVQAGVSSFHRSVTGQPRGPLCGMGICMECRVTINGRANCRSCQILCEPGMVVQTHE
jgi:predicted molibdopterin-dependent oxidoreductase YjgC